MRNRPLVTFAMLAALASAKVASADMISVTGIEQQANMSATYSAATDTPAVYFRSVSPANAIAVTHPASVVGAGGSASATASQYQAGSYSLDPNASLGIAFTGSNSGSITTIVDAVSDEASVSERLEMFFNTDRELFFSFDASVTTMGSLIPVQQLNGKLASVVVALSSNATTLHSLHDTDPSQSLFVSGTLPADGYKLTIQSVYKVKGNVGQSVMGSANYSVNFSVSAVPEPSLLGVLASLGCLFSLGRRRASLG